MPFSIPADELLPHIPLSARTILLVGCGNGELGAAYRRLNPKACLLGIETDPVAAALAGSHMQRVSTTSVELDPLPFAIPEGLDCIIYNDALQHLRDPAALMRRHADALNPNGVFLICTQNAEYWRVTERRLRGAGDDDEPDDPRGQGFTMAGMGEQLRKAGLVLIDVSSREPDPLAAQSFFEAIASGLARLGVDPADYAARAASSHLICRAAKEPIQQMILSGTMLAPVGGVSHVRVVHPLRACGSDPGVTTAIMDKVEEPPANDLVPRIFVLHRPALVGEQALDTVRALAGMGYLTVTEFDDHPDHFGVMRAGGDIGFSGVHALQTSTAAMAEILRKFNPEIAVFPNAVVSLPEVRNFADPGRVTLFFGALNRQQDWQPLMPVINAVAAQAGDRLRFQVVHDAAFFDSLQAPNKTFTPTCDYETYLRILGMSEVCFMPLADTAFNRAKSDLKFVEAGSCRTAALASTVVYGDSVEDGVTGLLFRDTTELHARLMRLIAMPELAMALGDRARKYVADHRMLAYQVAPRIAWYRSLWARREVLEAARRRRIELRTDAEGLMVRDWSA